MVKIKKIRVLTSGGDGAFRETNGLVDEFQTAAESIGIHASTDWSV